MAALGRPPQVTDTHERCLVAASVAFAQCGFEGTSLRDIASSVGISSAAVLHHFESKKRLYGAVLDRLTRSLEAYVSQPKTPISPETVSVMFEAFLDWTLENRGGAPLLLRELLENHERVTTARRLHLQPLIALYVADLKQGQKSGIFKTFDPEIFVFYTLGAITHFAVAHTTVDRMLGRSLASGVTRFRTFLRGTIVATLTSSPTESQRGSRLPAASARSRGTRRRTAAS